jgi:hypothetical protein
LEKKSYRSKGAGEEQHGDNSDYPHISAISSSPDSDFSRLVRYLTGSSSDDQILTALFLCNKAVCLSKLVSVISPHGRTFLSVDYTVCAKP